MTQSANGSFSSRITRWLKDDKFFFRKDSTGQYLFYPWSYPGESFIISQKQKPKTAFFLRSYAFFIILWVVLSVLFEELDIITRDVGSYSFLIYAMGFFPAYVLLVHFIIKEKEALILSKEDRPPKWRSLWMLLIPLFQIQGISSYIHQVPLAFLLLYGAGFIYTSYVVAKILLKRGYYFSS